MIAVSVAALVVTLTKDVPPQHPSLLSAPAYSCLGTRSWRSRAVGTSSTHQSAYVTSLAYER